MGVIFFGSSDTGWECCRALLDTGQPVAAIVTIQREFRISWSPDTVTNVRFRDFRELGERYRVPLIDATSDMRSDEFRTRLASFQPEMLIVAGWYHMIPRAVREVAPLGAIGLHASLLPKYRGNAPLVWALINGERRTGVTLFHLGTGVDDGDIIASREFTIGPDDTILQAIEATNRASVELMTSYVPQVLTGVAPRFRQDHSQATTVPARRPEDGLIDWSHRPAEAVHNFVRAQTAPYPGAFTYVSGRKLTIWRTRRSDLPTDGEPGQLVIDAAGAVRVTCAESTAVEIIEAGVDGGAALSGSDLAGVLQRAGVNGTTRVASPVRL